MKVWIVLLLAGCASAEAAIPTPPTEAPPREYILPDWGKIIEDCLALPARLDKLERLCAPSPTRTAGIECKCLPAGDPSDCECHDVADWLDADEDGTLFFPSDPTGDVTILMPDYSHLAPGTYDLVPVRRGR